MSKTPGRRLRDLLSRPGIVVSPGVYDGFSARIAHEVGFECLYMTGAGTCASKLGQPDLGFASLQEMREHAEMIANLDPQIPLIADADTGYGGPNMVARTVEAYHRSGVAALHIEDQIQSKRCGHLDGKEIVDLETFQQRINAASQARERLGSDIVLIARTDALQTHGLSEAVRRMKAAVRVGADVAFVEGITSREQGKAICAALAPTPVLLNMVENAVTPSMTPDEAERLGFKLIIFPLSALALAYEGIRKAYQTIKETGHTGTSKDFSPRKLFSIVGLAQAMRIDSRAGGSLYAKL